MQIYDTNRNLKIILNNNETEHYFGKFGSRPNYNTLNQRLNIILKKALLKSNKYTTGKIILKQIKRTKHKGCEIIYTKLTFSKIKQPETLSSLKITNNANDLFDTIQGILQNNIINCKLFSYNKKFYLICEAELVPKDFFKTSKYVTAYLEEYANLLSENVIKDIGKIIKNF